MTSKSQPSELETICAQIKRMEDSLNERKKSIEKLRSTLAKGRSKITAVGWPLKSLQTLIEATGSLAEDNPEIDLSTLVRQMRHGLDNLRLQFDRAFRDELEQHAKSANLDVKTVSDQLVIGPFCTLGGYSQRDRNHWNTLRLLLGASCHLMQRRS